MSVTLRRALWVCLGSLVWLTAACDLNPQPALPVEGHTGSGGKSTGNQGGTGVNLGGSVEVPTAGASTGGQSNVGGGAPSLGGGASGGQGSAGEASGGEASGGAPEAGGAGGEAGIGGEATLGAGGRG